MHHLLTENNLKTEIEKIITSAKNYLIFVIPGAQLSDRYKTALLKQVKNKNLEITMLFGDVHNELPENIKQDTLDFFKQFPNIEVLTEQGLSKKYYANESKAIFSSIKPPSFVESNNIEAGILIKKTLNKSVVNNTGNDYAMYFDTIIDKASLVFRNQPSYEKELRSEKNIFNNTSKNTEDVCDVIIPNKNGSYDY